MTDTIQPPAEFSTRAAYRDTIQRNLTALMKDAEKRVDDMDGWANVPVVTVRDLKEIMAATFEVPMPPPSETKAEVKTPATIVVSAECPTCGLGAVIPLEVGAVLETDITGSALKLKTKSKARTHVCGQLSLPDPATVNQAGLGLVGEPDVEDSIATPGEPCPFAGCSLEADHDGDHDLSADGIAVAEPTPIGKTRRKVH